MSTETNQDDPFAGWAEALEEQKSADAQAAHAEQGGPLSGEPVRSHGHTGNAGDAKGRRKPSG